MSESAHTLAASTAAACAVGRSLMVGSTVTPPSVSNPGTSLHLLTIGRPSTFVCAQVATHATGDAPGDASWATCANLGALRQLAMWAVETPRMRVRHDHLATHVLATRVVRRRQAMVGRQSSTDTEPTAT